jgi:Primase C terminal 2 (PriCT-2)
VADDLISFIERKAAEAKGNAAPPKLNGASKLNGAAKPNRNGHARDFVIPTNPPVFAPCEVARLCSALGFIPSDDRDDWLRVGFAMKWLAGHGWPESVCFEIWDEWSKRTKSNNYVEAEQLSQWKTFKIEGGITVASVFHMAKQHGWQEGAPAPRWAACVLSRMAHGDPSNGCNAGKGGR